MSVQTLPRPAVIYPDSDGEPMADNTLQFQEIVRLQGNLDAMFQEDQNVLVVGDHLWYAVEGRPDIRIGPDVMVIFGRPKGYRGSYMQWVEDGIAPQVVFEVLSPGNRFGKMLKKFQFYEKYGVEEYYVLDPDTQTMEGWIREGNRLREIPEINGWKSPRLGIRFDLSGPEVSIFRPDGRPFLTFVQIHALWLTSQSKAEQEMARAERERFRAILAEQKAEQAGQREEEARQREEEARQRAEEERQRAEAERQRAEKLAAKLREMGFDPGS